MRRRELTLRIATLALANCAAAALAQTAPPTPSPGSIAPDQGGAPGYQHSLERSRFVLGKSTSISERQVESNGFSKVVGENGVVAIDQRTGLFIAVESGGGDKDATSPMKESEPSRVMDPDRHNELVTEYFRSAGIPKDQIDGVHATTYLSSSGSLKDERPAPPKIDGYASVLERKIDGLPVVDSIAWARMNERGEVVGEWVYWPAIPAKALADAKRLEELVASTQKSDYLGRLPVGLPPGKVVIRHSSAATQGPFEAFASYDVIERKPTPEMAEKNMSVARSGVSVIRHFDVEGAERRLPQEKRELSAAYPEKQKHPLQEQRER